MNQLDPIHVEFNYPDKAREDFTLDIYIPERALADTHAFQKEAEQVCRLVIAQLNNPAAGIPLEDHPAEAIVLLTNTLGTEVTRHNPNIPKTIILSLTDIVPSHQDIYIKLDVPAGMSVGLFSERTAAQVYLIEEELKGEPLLGNVPMAEFIRGRLSDGLKTHAEIVTKETYQRLKINEQLTDLELDGLTPEQITKRTKVRMRSELEDFTAERDKFMEQVEPVPADSNEPPALGSGDFSRRFQNYLDGRATREDLIKGQRLIDEHREKLDNCKVKFTDMSTGKEVDLTFPRQFADKFFNMAGERGISVRTPLGDWDGDKLVPLNTNHSDDAKIIAPEPFEKAPDNLRPLLDLIFTGYAGSGPKDDVAPRLSGLPPAIQELFDKESFDDADTDTLVALMAIGNNAGEALKKRRINEYWDSVVTNASEGTRVAWDRIVNTDNQLQTMIDALTPEDRSVYISVVGEQLKSTSPVIYIRLGYSGKLTDALKKCAEIKNWPLA